MKRISQSTHNSQGQIWYQVEQEYRYFKKRHASIVNSIELFNRDFKPFTVKPVHVEGDVGRDVRAGLDKKIEWFIKKDYPYGLVGDQFVFAVDAAIQKREYNIPFYAVSLGVIGGAVYILNYVSHIKLSYTYHNLLDKN